MVTDSRAEAVVNRLAHRYGDRGFPEHNIDGGQNAVTIDDDESIFWDRTGDRQDAFDCLVRTILSQNTSDKASQPAHDALLATYDGDDIDLAESLASADQSMLAETISGAGLYNQKSETIIDTAAWVLEEFGSAAAFDRYVKDETPSVVRETLLSVRGVGPKTADCVLLFSGGRSGVFPVDTHVHRIYRRMGIAPPDADHEAVRETLEQDVSAAKCGFGHTASIQFGREYCTARTPACLEDPDACPMGDLCDQVGVYPETGEVVDPADVGE